MSFKIFTILFCVLCLNSIICQESDDALKVHGINIRLGKNDKDNAPLLVSKIIKGRGSDKEKFDAIFSWVSKNIAYDEQFFYTPSQSGPDAISNILKSRRTICLGYSQLMDSLCELAGITNTTVFGYAKDRFYDVGDSIYAHNHAWNSVKLDDLWYVYDVTWSHGVSEYRYTKSALFIIKLLDRFPEKYKKKTMRVPRKFRKRSICKEKIEPIVYYKLRFFNTLLRIWLMKFPIKVIEKHDKGISKDFYLSDPSLFSASHVPDDPMWGLLDRKKCSEFEQDSAFYYLTDSSYKNQESKGMNCAECDNYYLSSTQKKMEILTENSLAFNFNNRFITTYTYDELGKFLFIKSLNTDNNRLAIADSSVVFFGKSLTHMLDGRNRLTRFFKYQKTKNDTKAKLLLKDNVNHVKFIKTQVRVTIQHTKGFQEVTNKGSAFGTVYYNNIRRFNRFRTEYDYEKIKPYAPVRINELEKAHAKKTEQLDSLSTNIKKERNEFDSLLVNLSLNIWPQVFKNDSILSPFKACIKKRRLFFDNYKREIVELRRKIYPMEYKYTREIDYMLYDPALKCEKLFLSITRQTKLRQTVLNDILKLKRELTKAKELSVSQLNSFKEEAIKECESDFCWLSVNFPKESMVLRGFEALSRKQRYGLRVINKENEVERGRQSVINRAIKNGYKECNKDLAKDISKLKKKNKEIANYRKEISDPKIFNKKRYDKTILRLKKIL